MTNEYGGDFFVTAVSGGTSPEELNENGESVGDLGDLDPREILRYLRNPIPYPPALHPGLRRRLPIFAVAGALSILAALIPFPARRPTEVIVAGGVFFALVLAAAVVPWRRAPQWTWVIIPISFYAVIALLRDARGSDAGIMALYLLPAAWVAFYGRVTDVIVTLAALFAALAAPLYLVGSPTYSDSQWRLIIVTVAVATVVSFTFLELVTTDREQATRLAQRSILAQRSAEQAVAAREQLVSMLRAAVDTSIIGCDLDGTITVFSAGAERMLGYRAEDVLGQLSITHFFSAAELDVRAHEVGVSNPLTALTHRSNDRHTWAVTTRNGEALRVSLTVAARTDDSGAILGYVAGATDVTQREALAQERERVLQVEREVTAVLVEQNHRLREITRMKDDLVATVSHELRTPLTSIRGFAELLLDEHGDPLDEEQMRMIRAIDRNSAQMLNVTEDLLRDRDGTSTFHLHFADIDLIAIARDDIETVSALAAARNIELTLAAGDEPVMVHGDPARLHQLLSNLLSNAVKFCQEHGRVETSIDTFGHFARLDVRDDGPGIPADQRALLFERFYRAASATEAAIPGSGLGLAIARAVAEAHDGTVEIADVEGWSTTFRVLLPLASTEKLSVS